jgi:hypothetical protein
MSVYCDLDLRVERLWPVYGLLCCEADGLDASSSFYQFPDYGRTRKALFSLILLPLAGRCSFGLVTEYPVPDRTEPPLLHDAEDD